MDQRFGFEEISQITNLVPGLVAVYNIKKGEYVYVNDTLKKILGYSPKEFLEGGIQFATSLVHPDDLERILKENQAELSKANSKKFAKLLDNSIVNFEYRMRHKKGNWIWLFTEASIFSRDKSGKVENVINISIDITPLKNAETSLKDLRDKLEEKIEQRTKEISLNEKRFKALIENNSDGITLINKEGKIVYISPSARRMFGYPEQDLDKIDTFSYIHPEDRVLVINTFQKLIKNPNKPTKTQFRVRHFDGSYKWLEGVGTNLIADPSVNALISNFKDITEQKLNEARSEFLNKVTTKLLTDIDHRLTLQEIANLIVPFFADYCRVVIADVNGQVKEVVLNHEDASKISLIKELYDKYIDNPKATYGVNKILKSGKSEIISKLDLNYLKDNKDLIKLIQKIGLKSYMGVPLISRGKIIGAITFSSIEEGRFYSKDDLFFAEEIGRRVALTLENTRLYYEAQEELKQREKIEQNLIEERVRNELAQSVAQIGTYEWDIKNNKLFWSKEVEDLYGVSLGKNRKHKRWEKLVHPEDLPRVIKEMNHQMKTKDIIELEYRIVKQDGLICWIYSRAKVFFDENKKPIRTIGINIDVTNRRLMENNLAFLAQASKILSSSLDYQTTLNTVVKLAVPEIGDWCAVDMLNGDEKLELLALAHKDPKKIKWAINLRKINPVDMEASTGLPNVLRTGKSQLYPLVTDEMIIRSAKNEKDLNRIKKILNEMGGITSVMIVPIFSAGKAVGGLTFVTSETRRQYNQSDLSMAEELASRASLAIDNARLYESSQKAISIRDDFISVASHELKTPITSLKMYTQVLQKQSERNGATALTEYLGKIDSQVNKLTILISDLLNIAKVQQGKLEYRDEFFDLNNLIVETAEIIQATPNKHIIIVDGKLKHLILGDKDRIGQVITNLLTNAVKYSPSANKVIVKIQEDKEFVEVSVRDFGIGINKEHQTKIFERFYRVSDMNEKTFPGLGIGLYISYEIVKRHGGELKVKSKKRKGSIFSFTIPISRHKRLLPNS